MKSSRDLFSAVAPRALQLCVLAIVAVSAATAFGENVYVKAKTAELKQDKRGAATTLTTVPFGEQVDGKKDGTWYAVSYKGKKGFIYGGSLSAEKPADDPSLTAKDGSKLGAEEVDAGSAVRGVGETANKYASKNDIKPEHKVYLDYHQSFVPSDRKITEIPKNRDPVSSKDIENFLKEGKLGMYAE